MNAESMWGAGDAGRGQQLTRAIAEERAGEIARLLNRIPLLSYTVEDVLAETNSRGKTADRQMGAEPSRHCSKRPLAGGSGKLTSISDIRFERRA